MASCFSHPAVPLALACWLPKVRRRALLVAAALLSAMPDLDAIGYFQGVPYEAWNGHRGCTHSLVFAVVVAFVIGPWLGRRCEVGAMRASLFLCASIASHGLVDMLTDGGLGVALLWPFSQERLFFSFRPIAVAPLGVSAFFSSWGVDVLLSEALWLWLPAAIAGSVGLVLTRQRPPKPPA